MRNIKEKLKKNFWGDVTDDPTVLKTYSHDASIFTIKPQLVARPKTAEDIKQLVNFTKSERNLGNTLSLTARAAGSDMTGGSLTESIVVDCMRYLNHIKEIGNDYAVTEPGVYYRDFEKETLKRNLFLPSYPASREICAIGGMIANNSGGEKSLAFGKTERYVRSVKIILQDGNEYIFEKISLDALEAKKTLQTFEGEVYRKMHELLEHNFDLIQKARPTVTKNSAGYALWNVLNKEDKTFDLSKLIVGSQGTLGIITEATLSLVRPKTHSQMLVIFLKDMRSVGELAKTILQYKPESLESYDDHTFRLAAQYFPAIIKQLKGSIISLGLKFLPELWAVITGGIPKLVILAEFTGDSDAEVLQRAREAQKALDTFSVKSRLTKSAEETEKYWVVRRESFNLLREKIKKLRTAPFIDDMVVHPSDLPEFLPKLYALLDQYPLTYTIAGHVGDGNFHIIPLMDLSDTNSKNIIKELSEKAYDLVFQFHGSMTGEHNDGLIRTPYLEKMYGPAVYRVFEEVKNIFDPDTIFNPGKKVGGSIDFALRHISTE